MTKTERINKLQNAVCSNKSIELAICQGKDFLG